MCTHVTGTHQFLKTANNSHMAQQLTTNLLPKNMCSPLINGVQNIDGKCIWGETYFMAHQPYETSSVVGRNYYTLLSSHQMG